MAVLTMGFIDCLLGLDRFQSDAYSTLMDYELFGRNDKGKKCIDALDAWAGRSVWSKMEAIVEPWFVNFEIKMDHFGRALIFLVRK